MALTPSHSFSLSRLLDEKKPVCSRIFCELKVADDVLMGDVKWRFSGDDCESCGHQGLPSRNVLIRPS